jgi:hypothetical protein
LSENRLATWVLDPSTGHPEEPTGQALGRSTVDKATSRRRSIVEPVIVNWMRRDSESP